MKDVNKFAVYVYYCKNEQKLIHESKLKSLPIPSTCINNVKHDISITYKLDRKSFL